MSTSRVIEQLNNNKITKCDAYEDIIINQLIIDYRTAIEEEIEQDFYKVRKRSADAWKESFFELKPDADITKQNSFHEVDKVLRKNKLAFFKHNGLNSPMSELETFLSQLYRLFAPDLVPKMHTVYNDKLDITGVVSKAIPGFKSAMEDPLKESDLVIEAIDNNILTILEFKEIYKQYKSQQLYQLDDKEDNEILTFNLKDKVVNIKASDLKHFEIVRGNGISLALSYFLEEDDAHNRNISKKGQRIDFDMTLWIILHFFKNIGIMRIYDRTFRTPKPQQFDITERDLQDFPILTDAFPHFWPCFSNEGYLKRIMNAVVSSSGYSETKAYEKLAKNSVFKHFKWETFFKISLMYSEAYKAIGEVEVNNEVTLPNQTTSVVHVIAQHLKERTEQLKEALFKIEDFKLFYKHHGERVQKEFEAELQQRNEKLAERITKRKAVHRNFETTYPEYLKQKIDLDLIKKQADQLKETYSTLIRHESRRERRLRNTHCTF